MPFEEHHTGWPKLDLNFLHSFRACGALSILISAPQYTFRDIKSRAIRVDIDQFGGEVGIRAVVETYRISETGPVTSVS
jgi:hypothetical protein